MLTIPRPNPATRRNQKAEKKERIDRGLLLWRDVTDTVVDFLNFINFSFFPSVQLTSTWTLLDRILVVVVVFPFGSVRRRITFRRYTRKVPDVSFFFYEVPRERLATAAAAVIQSVSRFPFLYWVFHVINLRERGFSPFSFLPKKKMVLRGRRERKKLTTFFSGQPIYSWMLYTVSFLIDFSPSCLIQQLLTRHESETEILAKQKRNSDRKKKKEAPLLYKSWPVQFIEEGKV